MMFLSALSFLLLDISLALPHDWATTTLTGSTHLKQPLPGSTALPWTEQVPVSTKPNIQRRADLGSSSSGPTTISIPVPSTTPQLQLVSGSSTLSSLPPAICGFLPYWNGTKTTLGTCLLPSMNNFEYSGYQYLVQMSNRAVR